MGMDMLEGLFHPHNLVYVRCCQAALCSAIVREQLGEALQWGETLMEAARLVRGSKAHQELALRLARVKEELGDQEGAEAVQSSQAGEGLGSSRRIWNYSSNRRVSFDSH